MTRSKNFPAQPGNIPPPAHATNTADARPDAHNIAGDCAGDAPTPPPGRLVHHPGLLAFLMARTSSSFSSCVQAVAVDHIGGSGVNWQIGRAEFGDEIDLPAAPRALVEIYPRLAARYRATAGT